eukprot:gnl/TRDRNA2_/TRDRNA2_83279_c0_seq1.p1 gnl/TRDRNA2_/TRDRNA2_83279_c0~~gnl/TRDRNA2_/TRDRNA2_83279_c0_seq1.p1  ORF type:complete len:194 (+),score=37.45 gnl/TRDRNA2_/TRDRNA2_83279_c0_seq1:83-664(+)
MADSKGLVAWLDAQVAARPFATNCTVSGLISVVAELLRHLITSGVKRRPDLINACRQFVLGSCLVAPLATTWHGSVLELAFKGWDATRVPTVLAKTTAEQAIFAPIINTAFMVVQGVLEGRQLFEIQKDVREKFFSVWRSNIYFWVPVGLVSYRAVPSRWRPLFSNIVSVLWMLLLISKTSLAAESTAKAVRE